MAAKLLYRAAGYYYRGSSQQKSSGSCSNKNETGVDPDVVKKLEDSYKTLQAHPECKSLLKKCLTKEVLDELKNKKTSMGSTLMDVIRSGVYNLDSGIGVYASDYEEYHGFKPTDRQPAVDLGEKRISEFPPLDPEGKYIVSTRIRCGRTLKGYPFNPMLSEGQYLEMEKKGKYYALDGMKKADQQQLINDHFLFKEGSWNLPQQRKGLLGLDHLRLISMEKGSDVGKVLDRLIRGIKEIESKVPFARDDRLGWLTFCPTNLGSTVRASVHIKLPKVSARKDFKEICEKLKLQTRGIHGEHSDSENGIYDISNKARLGKSEVECVKEMYDGVKKLIEMEKAAS
ncbi:Arginine kinase [Aphelenchoides besseyi]|nr:Arginine kinase [Aphelenchoides besseyi]